MSKQALNIFEKIFGADTSSFPSFFTQKEMGRGNTTNKKQLIAYYNMSYILLIIIILSGFINLIAYQMQNTKKINEDPNTNNSISGFQFFLGFIIILFSIILSIIHYINNEKHMQPFPTILLFLTFCYGILITVFTGDRLFCIKGKNPESCMTVLTQGEIDKLS
jgi:Na+/proline symporter